MEKINLFHLLPPGYIDEQKETLSRLSEMQKNGITHHINANMHHIFLLSKYFNLYHLPRDEELLSELNHCVIHHTPDGTRSDIHPELRSILEEYKGDIPIVYRTYDPHPPKKLSLEFIQKWHDFSTTYIRSFDNEEDVIFSRWCYDTHLFGTYSPSASRSKFACMVHSNRSRRRHNLPPRAYHHHDIDLEKIHYKRRKIAQHESLDVYGVGWPAFMPGYRGPAYPFDQKYAILKKYRFNVITEPAIAEDFISEKILDSFLTLTVPVYLGPPTIEKHIPKKCFIDIRDFNSVHSLFKRLDTMSSEEYSAYVKNMEQHRDDIFRKFSTRENFTKPVYQWYNGKYNTAIGPQKTDFENIEKDITDLRLKTSSPFVGEFKRRGSLTKKKLQAGLVYFSRRIN